jgi:hypothetical protein
MNNSSFGFHWVREGGWKSSQKERMKGLFVATTNRNIKVVDKEGETLKNRDNTRLDTIKLYLSLLLP